MSLFRRILHLALIVVFIPMIFTCGCGGSGGGGGLNPVITGGESADISLKLAMVSYSGTYLTIPAGVTGNVHVNVTSKKRQVTVASRTVNYNAEYITFQDEIPVGDTYSVSLTAALHYSPSDTFEVIWSGAADIYMYSKEQLSKLDASQAASANSIFVKLSFVSTRAIPPVAAKLTIEPPLPAAGEITRGTVLPPITVKVFDQFGNLMPSAKEPVILCVPNCAFKSGASVSAIPSDGVAKFDAQIMESITAGPDGKIALKASYGIISVISQPMAVSIDLINDSSLAGFLQPAPAPSAAPASRAAASYSGQEIFLVINGVQHSVRADADGFWSVMFRSGSGPSSIVMRFTEPDGTQQRKEFQISSKKASIARIIVDPSGSLRVATFESEYPFDPLADASKLKNSALAEIEKANKNYAGAKKISGRIIVEGTDNLITAASGVAGAQLFLGPKNVSAAADAGGYFEFPEILAAGEYSLKAAAPDFYESAASFVITPADYGFDFSGITLKLKPVLNSPPAVSGLRTSGASDEVTINFRLFDAEANSCSAALYYSIDGGKNYTRSDNVSGAMAGLVNGEHTIVWRSLLDFQSNQNEVKVKIVPSDAKSEGTGAESPVFSLFNAPNEAVKLPSIANIQVSGTSENIIITYDLLDESNGPANISFYYSIDAGLNYAPSQNVSGDVSGVTPGTAKKITWASSADFKTNESFVKIRIIPASTSGPGRAAESQTFSVGNNSDSKLPVISNLQLSVSPDGKVFVSYDLSELDGNSCEVTFRYSIDAGASYAAAQSLSGDLSGVAPGAGKFIVWDSSADFRNAENDVIIKLLPVSKNGAGFEAVSQRFGVDFRAGRPYFSNVAIDSSSSEVLVKFDLIDIDSSLCTVEVRYSLDGGREFTDTVNLLAEGAASSSPLRIAAGSNKYIFWNAALDFKQSCDSVVLELAASDEYGRGTSSVTAAFRVDHSRLRPLVSNFKAVPSSIEVSLTYDLADSDNSKCTAEVSYSIDGGASFLTTSNISGDTAEVSSGSGKKISWYFYKDLMADQKDVRVRLTASDEYGAGLQTVSLPFAVDNSINRPAVSNITSAGVSGEISINYDLASIGGLASSIEVYFSTDSVNFARTLNISGDTAEVAAGPGRTLIWNSRMDIAGVYENAGLKLVPRDIYGAGAPAFIKLKIANNTPPAVSKVTTTGNSGNITIKFDLADNENDSCSVEIYYSIDGGANYTRTSAVTGSLSGLAAPASGNTVAWNSTANIVMVNQPNVMVKVLPYDGNGAGAAGSSAAFAVNNYVAPQVIAKLSSAGLSYEGASGASPLLLTLKFDAAVSAAAIDLSKITFKGYDLGSGNGSVTQASGNTVVITITGTSLESSITEADKIIGINGDFISNGVSFSAGNGIKSSTGNEVAASAAPAAVERIPGYVKIKYSNGAGRFSSSEIFSTSPLTGHFEISVGTAAPSFADSGTASGPDTVSHVFQVSVPGAPFAAGARVFYRFASQGGQKTDWIDYGAIPAADGSVFGTNNIVWSNARSGFEVKNTAIGPGMKNISVFYLNNGVYSYLGSAADAASSNGYTPGFYYVSNGGTPITVPTAQIVGYSIASSNGIENGYFAGGAVPAAPSVSNPMGLSGIQFKYNAENYQAYITSVIDTTACDPVRIYIDGVKVGRIPSNIYSSYPSFITSYEETTSSASLNQVVSQGGEIGFSFLSSNGNESALYKAVIPALVPAAPPQSSSSLRLAYDGGGNYCLTDISGAGYYSGTESCQVRVGNATVLTQTAISIPSNQLYGPTITSPSDAGGYLRLVNVTPDGNESMAVPGLSGGGLTYVPAKPDLSSIVIASNENNSANPQNAIDNALAQSVVFNPASDDQKLGINFTSCPAADTVELTINNPSAEKTVSLYSPGPASPISNSRLEFSLGAGSATSNLGIMLGSGQLENPMLISVCVASNGNYSTRASGPNIEASGLAVVFNPDFSPAGTTYSSPQSVTLSTSTSGADIYYTLDNTTPTISSNLYSAPLAINATTTVKAVAILSGSISSDVVSATFTIIDFNFIDNGSDITITGYTGSGGAGVIPGTIIGKPVKSIGAYAFDGRTDLTSVTIPSGVTSIGDYAFNLCSGLTNLAIPSTVTSIGLRAINGCTGLTSITIPESVTSVGMFAFNDCQGLTSISIPSSLSVVSRNAFSNCVNATSITIPSGVTNIDVYAFEGCSKVKNITIPSGVTNIGEGAFYNCASIEVVVIPSTVTGIGNSAFDHCGSLTGITLPSGLTTIGNGTFQYSGLTSITIPDSVTAINDNAFYHCSNLTSITLPANLTTIGNYVFEACPFTSITIPASVTSIGGGAFVGCTNLADVSIPSGVTSIQYNTFMGCTGLTGITIPASVTSIGNNAFNGCTGLPIVTIPSTGFTSLGDQAFFGCSNLTGVYFYCSPPPTGGTAVFDNCNAAFNVYYSSGATGWGSFWYSYATQSF